jgi:hypothetical protein
MSISFTALVATFLSPFRALGEQFDNREQA